MPLTVRDIEILRGRLTQGAEHAAGLRKAAWLKQTYAAPKELHAGLFAYLGQYGPLSKSGHTNGYDFYHDLVQRHRELDGAALICQEPRGWQRLMWPEVHALASKLAAHWARSGMEAGAKLALVLPMGAELVVAMAAALRLGLVIGIVPPLGPRFIGRRLKTLAPDFVVAAPLHAAVLHDLVESDKLLLGLPSAAPPGTCHGSHTYAPGAPVLAHFSPLHDPCDKPVMVSADVAYLGALRDVVLSFALRPGQHVAAPGVPLLAFQPALLFATMLAGATFVHVELADIRRDVNLLGALPIHTLGVTTELRDLLGYSNSRPLGSLTHWFRFPEEPENWEEWQRFASKQKLGGIPVSNVMYDSTAGGCILISPWLKQTATAMVPPPGLTHDIQALDESQQPSPGVGGIYVPGEQESGWIILGGGDDGYIYATATRPRGLLGQVYPESEVTAVTEELSFVEGAAVVPTPAMDGTNRFRFVLVVLTGPGRSVEGGENQPMYLAAIQDAIKQKLTPDWLPDRIELFPLHARRKEGAPDRDWIRDEYQTGMLYRKSRHPMFFNLNVLRKACQNSPLGRLASARAQKEA